MGLIKVDWPAPANVHAFFSTRKGGFSSGVYAGLNLGTHVQDDFDVVQKNRGLLRDELMLTHEPVWLNQVHGVDVFDANQPSNGIPTADAAVTQQVNLPITVMTADCLPVLFCDKSGKTIATAHAGWRGLCSGVLENTIRSMNVPASEILVWLGPAIGPNAFEVGDEVRAAFIDINTDAALAFKPGSIEGKWMADIYTLARQRLTTSGVDQIYGGQWCTFSDADNFYSYRRDGQTGRMAGLIWLTINS